MEKMPPKMHGGGKDISPMAKMSNEAKDLESYPGGVPGPGKIISGSHSKGKFMATPKYKSEKGMPKYQEKGPKKELVGKQKNLPEELKAKIEAAPGKYGDKKSMPAYKDKKSMPAYKDKKSMPKHSGKKPDSVSQIKKNAGLEGVDVLQQPEKFLGKKKK